MLATIDKSIELQNAKAQKLISKTIKVWFIIACNGLVLFSYYMIRYYGGSAIGGNLEAWAESSLKGYQTGDLIGNIFFAMHIFLAIILSLGGFIQLIPYLRKKHIKFHRYNGILFIVTAFLISLGGLYLIWVRGSTTTLIGSIGTSINALLIIYTAAKAWSTAKAKKYKEHRKWAIRVFLLANGVWFFRIGFMAWIMLNQGQRWSTDQLDGPFDYFIAYANFLIPLFILELYFKVTEGNNVIAKKTFALSMIFFLLITIIGIIATVLFLWQPVIGSLSN